MTFFCARVITRQWGGPKGISSAPAANAHVIINQKNIKRFVNLIGGGRGNAVKCVCGLKEYGLLTFSEGGEFLSFYPSLPTANFFHGEGRVRNLVFVPRKNRLF